MNPIRCIDCGKKVDNDTYLQCDDCRAMKKRLKHCVHAPETLDYLTNCSNCGKRLRAVKWVED